MIRSRKIELWHLTQVSSTLSNFSWTFCAMAQVVDHWHIRAEAGVWSWGKVCGTTVDAVKPAQVFVQVLQCSPVGIIPPIAYMMATASAENETFKNVGLLKCSKESKLEYPWILMKQRSRGLCM